MTTTTGAAGGGTATGFGVRRVSAALRWPGFLTTRVAAAFGASTVTGGSELLWASATLHGASSAISIVIALAPERATARNIWIFLTPTQTAGTSDASDGADELQRRSAGHSQEMEGGARA